MAIAPEAPRHEIPVRHPEIPFDESIPRHWLAANAVATQFFNGLNLVFPDGERFFIRAVRAHLDRVDDPRLLEDVRAFVGQEGRHAREHARYFDVLRAQGYRIDGFLRRFRAFDRFIDRWLPASVRLSMTAGAEHYTAIFGAFAVRSELIRLAHPALEKLIVWHATEEIEHKHVAFDVLQASHPGYVLRVFGFLLATAVLFGWTQAATRMLLRQDRELGLDAATLREHQRGLRHRRELFELFARGIRAYLRPGFHPSQSDDLAVARARLAGLGLVPAAA